MNENLRAINPIGLSGLEPRMPSTGMPICEIIDPTTLFVDPAYQRNVGDRGSAQVRRIIENFEWTKFKPPICAYSEIDGRTVLKVIDGQHTAIAAASNPHISAIPVMIVEAEDTMSQAQAFIGQNVDRLNVTNLQLHQAALVAGDENAIDVENTCRKAGIVVLKQPPASKKGQPRETTAVSTISALVQRHGPVRARIMLETIANAEMGQITAPQIKAVELLLTDPVFSEQLTPAIITDAIVLVLYSADEEAKVFAATHKSVPFWRALAIIWFQKCKKLRRPKQQAVA